MRFVFYISAFLICSCSSKKDQPKLQAPVVKPDTDSIVTNINLLKTTMREGDLIVRLGDDMISYSIKTLSEKDQSYSHAGIVITKGNQNFVLHILPDGFTADTIRYDPVDSFLNPAKNLSCGLYRYDLTPVQKKEFLDQLNQYASRHVHFDRLYDMKSEDKVYCSELIAKSLEKATSGKIRIRSSGIPKGMLPLMYSYFQKEKLTKKQIAERKFVGIDNLYLTEKCRQIMKFALHPTQ